MSLEWSNYKGLDVFIDLAKQINSDRYRIVLVGVEESVRILLPDSIIAIGRTSNKKELAEIYTAADYFINPTREDTYPTVNCEAIACGTPVISFDTGGSSETLKGCGILTPQKSAFDIFNCVYEMNDTKIKYSIDLNKFERIQRFSDYLYLYE